jgi:preprotein translocase subunit SecA
MLKRRGLKHEVLNAKQHQREAEIVAQAGQPGSITIATNMAGRGTDIKLGKDLDLSLSEAGLQIVGTERHESRRIDRQLRGRSGRQGDPGQSMFFLSLEDDLMRLFGSERIAAWMDKSGAEEGEVITGRLVSRAIGQAQKRVELQNFQSRKRLLEYDDVMNQQREVVYSMRLFALERGEQVKAEAVRMIEGAVERQVRTFLATTDKPENFDRQGLLQALMLQFLVNPESILDAEATPDVDAIVEAATQEGSAALTRKVTYLREFGQKIGIPDVDAQILSQVMLTVLDDKWKDHLYDLDLLRNAIHYRSYGQRDPLVEYKQEAYEMFEGLMADIQSTFTERFLKVQVQADQPRRPPPPPPPPVADTADALFMGSAPAAAPPPALKSSLGRLPGDRGSVPEVGRNDPCPCGSGKKYKKCHGAGR